MIYLDNAATTEPNKEALNEAVRIYTEHFHNSSASYKQGAEVHALIQECKRTILETLTDDVDDYDIVFTASGTEADNLAIRSAGSILVSNQEHAAVYESANALWEHDYDDEGCRHDYPLADFTAPTVSYIIGEHQHQEMVSVIHVNNETGSINDIAALAEAVKEKYSNVLFHSDGVQAYGKIPFRFTKDIDMYSISAHKIGGIKGVGALVYRKEIEHRLSPVIYGGGQENGLRSGTENVLGIIDFAEAVKRWGVPKGSGTGDPRFKFDTRVRVNYAVARLIKETLWERLDKKYFARISPESGSPYIMTVSALGQSGEVIQQALAERGILVGTGSACSSNHAENKGRVLRAMGYSDEYINGAIRFSFSPDTTVKEVQEAADAANEIVRDLCK